MDSIETLGKACAAVKGKAVYGSKKESFRRMAMIASHIRGKKFDDKDCCAVLIALKLSRESFEHKDDHMVDLAGYASIMNELHEGEQK